MIIPRARQGDVVYPILVAPLIVDPALPEYDVVHYVINPSPHVMFVFPARKDVEQRNWLKIPKVLTDCGYTYSKERDAWINAHSTWMK
jgi:hypothetical protein